MFIDLCPQSGYGVYDWWGVPKPGLEALYECNQPVGVFLKITGGKAAIRAANDCPRALEGLTLEWVMLDENQNSIWSGALDGITLEADNAAPLASAELDLADGGVYNAYLTLKDAQGAAVTKNRYTDILNHPRHPEGHCDRMSKELGVRLFHV